jgi:hypothetical protein
MPNLEIDGVGEIEVDEGFKNLSPDQQNSFVQSVIQQAKPQLAQNNQNQISQDSFSSRNLKRAGNFAAGIPQGLGNSVIGGVQAATDVGESAARLIEKLYFGDNIGMQTFGNRLAEQVKVRKEEQDKLPTSEKVGTVLGEILPFLTTGVGTGAKVAAATGSKIAGLAVGSGVGGAVSQGLSQQEEVGLENRAKETLGGAITGSLFGAGLGTVAKVAGGSYNIGKKLVTAKSPVDIIAAKLPRQETVALLDKLKNVDNLPENPILLPDIAGDSIKGLTRAVGKISTARDIVHDALEKRSEGASKRIINHLSKDVSSVNSYFGNLDDLIKSRRDLSAPLYEKAFGKGKSLEAIDEEYAAKINDLLQRKSISGSTYSSDKINQKSLNKSGEELKILEEWKNARQSAVPVGGPQLSVKGNEKLFEKIQPELKSVRKEFRISPDEAPDNSLLLLDMVKQSLYDKAETLKRTGAKYAATIPDGLRVELTQKLKALSPDYSQALSIFEDSSKLINAQQKGLQFSKLKPEEIKRQMLLLSPAERDSYRIGAREDLQKTVFSTPDGADSSKRIFGNDFKREQLKAVIGNDLKFEEFQTKMISEMKAADTKAKVLGGSRTDYNLTGDDEFLNEAIKGSLTVAKSKLNPFTLIEATHNALSNKFAGINKKNADELAKILVNRGASIKALESILRRQKEPLQKRVITDVKQYILTNLATQSTLENQ